MKPSQMLLLVGLVVVLVLAGGLVQGFYTNRWGVPADMKRLAERFDQIPETFGDWRLVKTDELGDNTRNMLQCEGYVVHSYEHLPTGSVVNMFIILGPPGPTVVHEPEICYSSKAYDIMEKKHVVDVGEVDGFSNEFWSQTFKPRGIDEDLLRVYYAWSPGGGWSAPDSAWGQNRIAFGGKPYLFKLQLAAKLRPDTNLKEGDVGRKFLEAYLPVVNPILLNPADDAAAPAAAGDES